MSLLPVGISGEAQYQIERSLRFNSADSAYLSWTPASAGNRKTWTWSGWVKRGELSISQVLFGAQVDANTNTTITLHSDNTLRFRRESSGIVVADGYTSAVYRDPSAWYHIVCKYDSAQASASNRVIFYVNGVAQAFSWSTTLPLDHQSNINQDILHRIGQNIQFTSYLDGYLTEVHFIDGSALDPTSFGEFNTDTGVWQPKPYAGSYGTNGFYLNFSDNSGTTSTTLGKDSSGNGNNWTPSNFSVTAGAGNDSLVDTPTPYGTDTGAGGEVRGNYATLNPLSTNSGFTLLSGNLDYAESGAISECRPSPATMAISSGKWYWEVNTATVGGGNYTTFLGIWDATNLVTSYTQNRVNGYAYATNGSKVDASAIASYGSAMSNGDVIGVAFDADAGTIEFFKNNTSQGTAFTGISGSYVPVVCFNSGITSYSMSGSVNFGQRPFAYTAPSGFLSLCTQNLPEPTIVDGGDYFNTVLWTGDGATTRSITGLSFAPDFIWNKTRSNADDHRLVDIVRAGGTDLSSSVLYSNLTNAQDNASGYITQTSSGFDLGVSATPFNMSGRTYAAWNWKANGAGVSNTDGTITSTVSANTDSGFSIVTYTGNATSGATVGHGLAVKPAMIIGKNRSGAAQNWQVWHQSMGDNVMQLNSTAAQVASTSNSVFLVSGINSTVFQLGTNPSINGSSTTQVAYCFAAIPGYSAFGSYVGNGSSTDGPFVFCNFRPALVMVKRTNTTGNWRLQDTARNEYNTDPHVLFPNLSDAEGTGSTNDIDILSNGFKLRNNSTDYNASGSTYIYMAFSEVGFKYALGR